MFDAHGDLAALVYEADQDPDAIHWEQRDAKFRVFAAASLTAVETRKALVCRWTEMHR